MKKILFLAVIALIAVPVFAGGTLAIKEIPCVMTIDKTVTLTVNPAQITLVGDPCDPSAKVYRGYTGVTITHNFPVIVKALIVPFGPSLGPAAEYKTYLAMAPQYMPQTAAQWGFAPNPANPLYLNTPAPAPTGEMFYVGAAVLNVDITYTPSSPTAQQVATVGLTITDNL